MKLELIFLLIGLSIGYFVRFLQEKGFTDNSKIVVQKPLEKNETLYKSIMQEYFG